MEKRFSSDLVGRQPAREVLSERAVASPRNGLNVPTCSCLTVKLHRNQSTPAPHPRGEWGIGLPFAGPLLGGVGVGSWPRSASLFWRSSLPMNRHNECFAIDSSLSPREGRVGREAERGVPRKSSHLSPTLSSLWGREGEEVAIPPMFMVSIRVPILEVFPPHEPACSPGFSRWCVGESTCPGLFYARPPEGGTPYMPPATKPKSFSHPSHD